MNFQDLLQRQELRLAHLLGLASFLNVLWWRLSTLSCAALNALSLSTVPTGVIVSVFPSVEILRSVIGVICSSSRIGLSIISAALFPKEVSRLIIKPPR